MHFRPFENNVSTPSVFQDFDEDLVYMLAHLMKCKCQ